MIHSLRSRRRTHAATTRLRPNASWSRCAERDDEPCSSRPSPEHSNTRCKPATASCESRHRPSSRAPGQSDCCCRSTRGAARRHMEQWVYPRPMDGRRPLSALSRLGPIRVARDVDADHGGGRVRCPRHSSPRQPAVTPPRAAETFPYLDPRLGGRHDPRVVDANSAADGRGNITESHWPR
jgi:hypothetical protein